MKNLIQYSFKVQEGFYDYSQGKINLSQLIFILKDIERKEINKLDVYQGESLWFRFFEGDTTATDISDIKKALELPGNHPEHKRMLHLFELAYDLHGDMKVFFS